MPVWGRSAGQVIAVDAVASVFRQALAEPAKRSWENHGSHHLWRRGNKAHGDIEFLA